MNYLRNWYIFNTEFERKNWVLLNTLANTYEIICMTDNEWVSRGTTLDENISH